MEKIIILALVFASIGLLIWNIIKVFKGKDSCCSCGSSKDCQEDNCQEDKPGS